MNKPKRKTFPRAPGPVPYGYAPVTGKKLLMKRDPDEYAVVRRIMADYDGGKGYTYSQVAARLNAVGYATRRGCNWKPYTVYNVIMRELKLADD